MMQCLGLSLFVFLTVFCQSCCKIDYYWREYTGVIPPDAVIVGKDISGDDLYVGQGYLKNIGWEVAPIYKGVKEVYAVAFGKALKIDKYIKILCGPQNNFHWLLTDRNKIENDKKGKHVVIGGHEYDENNNVGYLCIGRISHEGETKIGKITAFDVRGSWYNFYFNALGVQKKLDFPYQILYFDENSVIDPRQ